ncbi:MAG: ChaN family lipoprotein [Phycisphaerales bacterium]
MNRVILALAVAAMLTGPCTRADEIALLPLGDPSRAYILASGSAGEVIDCRHPAPAESDPAARFEAMIADLATCDVVLIGEHHANLPGHQFEERVLRGLLATGRPLALGMEFFEVQDDPALAGYVNGSINLPTLIEQTDWYGPGGTNYNFAYYQPLVDAMRERKLPVHGLNIPREWVRAASRGTRDSLTDEQKDRMPDPGPVDERHRHAVDRMMGGFGATMPEMFSGMYRGQTTWDSSMAESVRRIRRDAGGQKPLVVVVVGIGHVGHGLGIPSRLLAAEPSLKVRVVACVSAERPKEDERVHPGFEPKESATFSRGFGDYVYVLPDTQGEQAYPRLGLRLAAKTGPETVAAVEIASVPAGSVADRAGLRKGDRIVSIAGQGVHTVTEAAIALNRLSWDTVAPFVVARSDENAATPTELTVPVGLVPAIDGEEDWLKSRPASALIDQFDPMSDRAYAATGKEKPAGRHTRVVMFRDKPVRIDEVDGPTLISAWKLDDHSRPVLGIIPAGDAAGAVRIVLSRDESGKVVSQRRFDLTGREF